MICECGTQGQLDTAGHWFCYKCGNKFKAVFNLTQHTPSLGQEGVVEPDKETKQRIIELLTFNEIPYKDEIKSRARKLADIAEDAGLPYVLIGGAPFLMPTLEHELRKRDLTPVYAFSKRKSVERALANGSIEKTQVFAHEGFIQGFEYYDDR